MKEDLFAEAFKVIQDFGVELQNKKSSIEYVLFGGQFPESKLPHSIENIIKSSELVTVAVKNTQPEVLISLEAIPALLYGYTSDAEARKFFKEKIKLIASSDANIDQLFNLYIKK